MWHSVYFDEHLLKHGYLSAEWLIDVTRLIIVPLAFIRTVDGSSSFVQGGRAARSL